MKQPLFLVIGCSGSGKTSVVPPLQALFGSDRQVWDFDAHDFPGLPVLKAWAPGDDPAPYNRRKNLCLQSAAQHRPTPILCGTLLPHEVDDATRRTFAAIHWLGLVADAATITARLRERRWDEALIAIHAKAHEWYPKMAKEVSPPMPLLDTSRLTVPQVAAEVREWICRRETGC
jgi:hypothetical protein